MTEPQLSEEMEIVTKFRQFLANWDYAHLTRKVSVEESRQMCDEFALTLATALEEQRQELLSEVESWLVDDAPVTDKAIINVYDDKTVIEIFELHRVVANRLRAELRAKLVEMKEGNEKYL